MKDESEMAFFLVGIGRLIFKMTLYKQLLDLLISSSNSCGHHERSS